MSEIREGYNDIKGHNAIKEEEVMLDVFRKIIKLICPQSLIESINRVLREVSWGVNKDRPQERSQKITNVDPLFKNGNRDYSENYNLVSLKWVVEKLLERSLSDRIYLHLEMLGLLRIVSFALGRSPKFDLNVFDRWMRVVHSLLIEVGVVGIILMGGLSPWCSVRITAGTSLVSNINNG